MSDFKQEMSETEMRGMEETREVPSPDSVNHSGDGAEPSGGASTAVESADASNDDAAKPCAKKKPNEGGAGGAQANPAAQKILAQINALLNSSGALDEARFKSIRKDYDALGYGEDDELGRDIAAALERAREKIHGQIERRKKRVDEIRAWLAESKQALQDGHLKPALALGKKIRRAIGNIPGLSAEHKKEFTSALRAMQPRTNELRKWHHWSTNQAREKLIADIAALQETKQHPVELARRIREARETWRNWDRIGDSAPAVLWKKFNQTCTEAYAPCKEHFEKRAKTIDGNVREYETLCADLEKLFEETDWRKPQWREVDETLHKSFGRRRKLRPLPHKMKRILDQRFSVITAKFHEAMERECERERKRRERAIVAIRALDDDKVDLKAALNTVKEEQKQWKPTVRSKPSVENQLWSEFREVCDAVFDRRNRQHKETRLTEKSNLDARKESCERIRAILAEDDDAVGAARAEVQKIRDAWGGLGAVPKKERDAIDKKFRACVRDYEQRLAAIHNAGLRALDDALEQRAALCMVLETALGQDKTAAAALLKKSRAAWDKCNGDAGDEITARFDAAAAHLENNTAPADLAAEQQANLADKQKICLHLEVLAGTESPAEFAAERLLLQAERLSGAMGRKSGVEESAAETFRQLCRRYWNGGAVPAADAEKLEERFRRARGSFA